MKRIALVLACLCVAMPLTACETMSTGQSPAPLSTTVIDENARITADQAFDVALDAVNLAVDFKVRIPGRADDRQPFIPGTSAARELATVIRAVNQALNAAASFARAGNTASYAAALTEAQTGIAQLRVLIKR
jgi:hypothetical protein